MKSPSSHSASQPTDRCIRCEQSWKRMNELIHLDHVSDCVAERHMQSSSMRGAGQEWLISNVSLSLEGQSRVSAPLKVGRGWTDLSLRNQSDRHLRSIAKNSEPLVTTPDPVTLPVTVTVTGLTRQQQWSRSTRNYCSTLGHICHTYCERISLSIGHPQAIVPMSSSDGIDRSNKHPSL